MTETSDVALSKVLALLALLLALLQRRLTLRSIRCSLYYLLYKYKHANTDALLPVQKRKY
jgi:hypothetical protein